MLKGIAVVLISLYLLVTLLGKAFQLERLVFLYEKFLLFASFALAVVFQPELRRGLMHWGKPAFSAGGPIKSAKISINWWNPPFSCRGVRLAG